jgi:four helix bundle protein
MSVQNIYCLSGIAHSYRLTADSCKKWRYFVRNVKEYEVFKRAHKLVLEVYKMTKNFPKEELYGVVSQLRRAGYSIPMNLVEGGTRQGEKEFSQLVNIALGSCEEMRYQLLLSKDLGYIDLEKYEQLDNEAEIVKKMRSKLYLKISSRELKAES